MIIQFIKYSSLSGLLGLRIERLWIRVIVTRAVSILPLLAMVYWDKSTVELVATSVNVMQVSVLVSKADLLI